MIKVTVLFNHPTNPQEFERHYADKHLPIAGKPAYHRMAELYFPSQPQMQTPLGSPEGQAAAAAACQSISTLSLP